MMETEMDPAKKNSNNLTWLTAPEDVIKASRHENFVSYKN
jgi:hypothetical protein